MKRRIAILGSVIVLLGCSAATIADEKKYPISIKFESPYSPRSIQLVLGSPEYVTMLEKEQEEFLKEKLAKVTMLEALARNKKTIDDQIALLHKYVNKTRYVFSGSTPSGWDCSGLTKWFYGEIGIEIEHSATKQAKFAGKKVEDPKIGDIVAFSHNSSKRYYHVGIYIGSNEIIHAGFKPGTKTEIINLNSAYFKNSKITFIRVIEN